MATPLYAGVGKASRQRTASKFSLLGLAQAVSLPAAAAVFVLYKFVLKKGSKKPAVPAKPSAPAVKADKPKPRRDVKVKRDPEAQAIARAIARQQQAVGLSSDDTMEASGKILCTYPLLLDFLTNAMCTIVQVLHEEEVDALHGAEAVGAAGTKALNAQSDGNFIKMLQGYVLCMDPTMHCMHLHACRVHDAHFCTRSEILCFLATGWGTRWS